MASAVAAPACFRAPARLSGSTSSSRGSSSGCSSAPLALLALELGWGGASTSNSLTTGLRGAGAPVLMGSARMTVLARAPIGTLKHVATLATPLGCARALCGRCFCMDADALAPCPTDLFRPCMANRRD
jgi:hypothetical protein